MKKARVRKVGHSARKEKTLLPFIIILSVTFLMLLALLAENIFQELITGQITSEDAILVGCSDDSIKQVWDRGFKESSSDIVIIKKVTQGSECRFFEAYKVKDNTHLYYILGGSKNRTSTYGSYRRYYNTTTLSFSKVSFNPGFLNSSINYSQLIANLADLGYSDYYDYLDDYDYDLDYAMNISNRSLTSENEAITAMTNNFNISLSAFDYFYGSGNNRIYEYYRTNYSDNSSKSLYAITYAGLALDYMGYQYSLSAYDPNYVCVPDWQEYNYTIYGADQVRVYYNDKNWCNNYTDEPEERTINVSYDIDNNGVIGNIANSFSSNANLSVYIDYSLPGSYPYFVPNINRKIEFIEGSLIRVGFNYNFSSPLNVRAIEVDKQNSSSNFGYIIVNGLEANKTITLDRLNSTSNSVCVKDDEVEDISDVSEDCDEHDEYIVNCPGSISGFRCELSNNTFVLYGLMHSAVKEFKIDNSTNDNQSATCTQLWVCGEWGSCSANQRTRVCIDENNCNNLTGKPVEAEACVSCTSVWNCTEWEPSKCPKNGTQNRTCLDVNNCNPSNPPKPEESQLCEYKEVISGKLLIVFVFLILIIILVVIIYVLYIKPQNNQSIETPTVIENIKTEGSSDSSSEECQ